jgi:hypothetical protein
MDPRRNLRRKGRRWRGGPGVVPAEVMRSAIEFLGRRCCWCTPCRACRSAAWVARMGWCRFCIFILMAYFACVSLASLSSSVRGGAGQANPPRQLTTPSAADAHMVIRRSVGSHPPARMVWELCRTPGARTRRPVTTTVVIWGENLVCTAQDRRKIL